MFQSHDVGDRVLENWETSEYRVVQTKRDLEGIPVYGVGMRETVERAWNLRRGRVLSCGRRGLGR